MMKAIDCSFYYTSRKCLLCDKWVDFKWILPEDEPKESIICEDCKKFFMELKNGREKD